MKPRNGAANRYMNNNERALVNTDMLRRWEYGELTDEEEIDLFQKLVNSGMAWKLQDMYGRHAIKMIKAGLITEPDKDKLRKIMRDRFAAERNPRNRRLKKTYE